MISQMHSPSILSSSSVEQHLVGVEQHLVGVVAPFTTCHASLPCFPDDASACVVLLWQALLETQTDIRALVPGFTFNLGMCGHFYRKGSPADINGSSSLVEHKDNFWWFGHTYSHRQVHLMTNLSLLRDEIEMNLQFAREMHLPIIEKGYAVSPHHSGIYPVHSMLYWVWQHVLNVSVTSTEEYPHMYPFQKRRGFIHHGVMVSESCC